jgi:predicted aspartyl protease
MIRVVFNADTFVPKQRSVKATVKLRTKDKKGQVKALIDSGATDNFIAPVTVPSTLGLPPLD